MYKYHWDTPGMQWNVYDPAGNYVCSFLHAIDAKEFCDAANEELRNAESK